MLLVLLIVTTQTVSAKVWVTPHQCLLSSSLDLQPATQGLHLAKLSLQSLEAAVTVSGANISSEAKKLLETVTQTGRFRLTAVTQLIDRLEGLSESRVRRELSNPLYSVGEVADWAFGLVSHDNFQRYKTAVASQLEELQEDGEELHSTVEANSKALRESLDILQKFQGWLDKLLEANDAIISTEKFVLKVMRLKFELDTCLGSLEGLARILGEVLDRGDLGLASRYLYSTEHLARQLLILNDRSSGLSPLYPASQAKRYFQLPLTLTAVNSTHLHSILRIPMVDPDSIFEEEEQNFHDGFVQLQNFKYSTLLTFPQFSDCVSSTRGADTLCSLRPCLISQTGREEGASCIALNNTQYLISHTHNSLKSECGGSTSLLALNTRTEGEEYSHMEIPLHCQVNSQHYIIKSVASPSILGQGAPVVNTIYSIRPEAIIINQTKTHTHRSIRVETKAIIRQLNNSRHYHTKVLPPSPPHLLPLALAGSGLGSLALLAAVIVALLLICRR